MSFLRKGIQLVMTVDGDDVALVCKANQAGLAVQALSRWRTTSAGKGDLAVIYQHQLGCNGAAGGKSTAAGTDINLYGSYDIRPTTATRLWTFLKALLMLNQVR